MARNLKTSLASLLKDKSFQERDEFLYQVTADCRRFRRCHLAQETRRLVAAQFQNMVYSEYLPALMGSSGVKTTLYTVIPHVDVVDEKTQAACRLPLAIQPHPQPWHNE